MRSRSFAVANSPNLLKETLIDPDIYGDPHTGGVVVAPSVAAFYPWDRKIVRVHVCRIHGSLRLVDIDLDFWVDKILRASHSTLGCHTENSKKEKNEKKIIVTKKRFYEKMILRKIISRKNDF